MNINNKILKIKILTFSIILLLLQVSFSSAISTNNKPVKSNNETVEDYLFVIKTDSKICDFLWYRFLTLRNKADIISGLMEKFFYYPRIYRFLAYYFKIIVLRATPYIILRQCLECDWINSSNFYLFINDKQVLNFTSSD